MQETHKCHSIGNDLLVNNWALRQELGSIVSLMHMQIGKLHTAHTEEEIKKKQRKIFVVLKPNRNWGRLLIRLAISQESRNQDRSVHSLTDSSLVLAICRGTESNGTRTRASERASMLCVCVTMWEKLARICECRELAAARSPGVGVYSGIYIKNFIRSAGLEGELREQP
jgi:hypothetical protein